VSGDGAGRLLARLLIESVLDAGGDRPLGAELSATTVDTILTAGGEHRITPAIARRVKGAPDAPTEWVRALAPHRTMQLMRHMQAAGDLSLIGATFERQGVAWAVGKGPVAADLIWPSPDMREYYDLDVFVNRRDFAVALDALLQSGCVLVDRNWLELNRSRRAEIALKGPAGTHIDLHWDIAVTPKLRRAFDTDMDGMLNRARPARLGSGVEVRVFDPIDTVAHLVFHAAQAGANRLMWMADIHHAAALPGFDWAEFGRRSERARTAVPTAIVLERVARCLGFRVQPPAAVLAPAAGVWGSLARRRDHAHPFPGLPGDPHRGGTVFSSARAGVTASAVNAMADMWITRVTERRVDRKGPDDRVLYRDVADARARREYLAAVAG